MLPWTRYPVEYLFVIIKINCDYFSKFFPSRWIITLYTKHYDIINDLFISHSYVKNFILLIIILLPT